MVLPTLSLETVIDRLAPVPLPDLTGRTALVTGGTAGIGLATATALARAGAHVVLTARDPRRGSDAAGVVRAGLGDGPGSVDVADLDVSSFTSVDALVGEWGTRALDIVVLNAGRNGGRTRHETVDGHERTMATNALGHLRLVHGLLPALRAGSGRVVTVGSLMANRAEPTASDLCLEHDWTPSRAYARSKFACLVIARELPRRAGVAALAAHPGWTFTKILGSGRFMAFGTAFGRLTHLGQSPADGAQPILAAAVGLPGLGEPTGYVGPRRGTAGAPAVATPPRPLLDADLRAAWWDALCEHADVPSGWA